ncbi:tetratricopeptide repeat protein [Pseudenhygromyxa sp. WMMC2535]|uniref:tetratricopeptide repeat protein n=1 Tax=Pseudenhygromyxa sp. WMMC2535 TaxID=2712867 RepID=UPI001553E6D6|nr:tetratricopeptide repeat protein [Pseudenhygromyxa sp. WMMC2535]NVB39086.1 tetratricopeptide repeat protein [Pseudenhygromyxa sp. WMMC2535]
MRARSPARRCLVGLSVAGLLALASLRPATAAAASPRQGEGFALDDAVERLADIESVLVSAEKAANADPEASEEELAKRVVTGQLMLAERDLEGAAIVFLDVLENYPNSQAASQALYFLGEALALLEMDRWAIECFQGNLLDSSNDGRRFHQRSMARLFDLAVPRREPGFARRPGLSATPEVRARLESLGMETESKPPEGLVEAAAILRVAAAVEAIPGGERDLDLRYSYGRWLYFQGRHDEAILSLDSVSPLDVPMSTGGIGAQWRVRAAYLAGAAALAEGEIDDALARFTALTQSYPRGERDKRIVELAMLARARIHHDQGETELAVRYYRGISRDSPFFPEAMYETAWTLLAAGSYDRALQALDLLLVYDPDSPIVPEIKQLRGKVKIQMRSWQEAEGEFLALRREFDDLSRRLGASLETKGDAATYFSAVAAEDLEHFSLAAVMPVEAVGVAESLPRATQTVDLANEVGEVEAMLFETRALLARMEEAVAARERARLFTDLGAHLSSLDALDIELLDLEEQLLFRARRGVSGAGLADIEAQRKTLRERVDNPLGDGSSRDDVSVDLRERAEEIHQLDLTVQALRAQLIATERYYDETREDQRIDRQGFLNQAAELRDEVAALEAEVATLEAEVEKEQTAMRFSDPWAEAQRAAVDAYANFLDRAFSALLEAKPDSGARKVWDRARGLHDRVDEGRERLDAAAGRRLRRAIQILREERINLDAYKDELEGKKGETRELVGEVMQASYRDVVGELANLVTRSEVGLLDVAWAIQEVEAEEIRRLETHRERDMRELDRILDQTFEEAQ